MKETLENAIYKNMAKLLIGDGIARILGFVITPVLTRIYLPAEMGSLAVFTSFVAILIPFSTLRYPLLIPVLKDEKMAFSLSYATFLMLLCSTILLIISLFFFKSDIFSLFSVEELSDFWWLIPISFFSMGLYELFYQWAIRKKLMGTMVYWNTFWYSKKNMLTVTHEMIIEHMQIPVVLFDYEGILADFNSSMKGVAGNLEYDNREQNIEWFVRENDLPVKPGEDTFEWKHNDRIYDCRIERLSDEKNRLLGTIIVMQDVSELKKAYAELKNMVIYDQLTGVYSMYSFMEHCKQYDEYNGSVAVVVCDINHLSDINIQYGQKAGNQALINVAGVLKKILMDRAYIARINEGNFVAVMKNVTDAEAGKTFEQIKRTVEKECNNGKFGVTIEYGIAMRKASNRWIMDIVHEAVNDMRDRKGR